MFARRGGRLGVVEYSELPPSMAGAADENSGELRFSATMMRDAPVLCGVVLDAHKAPLSAADPASQLITPGR